MYVCRCVIVCTYIYINILCTYVLCVPEMYVLYCRITGGRYLPLYIYIHIYTCRDQPRHHYMSVNKYIYIYVYIYV